MSIFAGRAWRCCVAASLSCAFLALPVWAARAFAAEESVLYAFKGGVDGAYPAAGLTFMGGMLYGTTSSGGTSSLSYGEGCDYIATGCGVVFAASLAGAETVLHSFQGSEAAGANDGHASLPMSGLTRVGNTLYGTTYWGGSLGSPCDWGCGTLYAINAQGKVTMLHAFTGTDGAYPDSGVLQFGNQLVGSTSFGGGTTGFGVMFEMAMNGGAQVVVHSFAQGAGDGEIPAGALIKAGVTLYGTTTQGGAYGHGTIFRISPTGTETVIYAFKGGADGAGPTGLISVGGVLYGTTTSGGDMACTGGCGTVYALNEHGVKTVIHRFRAGQDGANPNGPLVELGGRFYGTTLNGGAANDGTVFSVGPGGMEIIEHAFAGGADGAHPRGSLIGVLGKLYGTTYFGGEGRGCDPYNAGTGCGTIFRISP
jgi:uncharacterized repeat protein (TIGR03803 family)